MAERYIFRNLKVPLVYSIQDIVRNLAQSLQIPASALGGGALGIVLGHCLVGVMQPVIADQLHVAASMFQFDLTELVLIPGLIVLAALVGYMPAMSAYKTDVAKSLTVNP